MKLGLVLLAALPALLAQPVQVTVVSATDGAPLPGVKVELTQNGNAMQRGTTGAQGEFRFDAVPEGDYSAEVTLAGYRDSGRGANGAGRRVHVSAGANPVRLEIRMMRLGQVSGRVTGQGKPVARADVQLFLAGNFTGQLERTDERGEFHFHDVDPGTYILSARAIQGSTPPAEEDGQKLGWLRTWFPSASDPGGAGKVVVTAGADLIGQDIALRTAPLHRVSGRVLSGKGEPLRGISVKAVPPEEFATGIFEVATTSGDDGAFRFDGLPDGNWRLTAEAKAEGAELYTALAETVSGRDIDRVELRLTPPFALTGKVVRTPTGTAAEKKQVALMLAPSVGGYRLSVGKTDDDGSFRMENVVQGTYRWQPTSPGAPYYLASIEMNGRDVTGEWVEITPGTLPATITYRADGGTVRGTVEDCGGGTVVLAPREPALQYGEFVRQAKCGQGGRFEIGAIRPGEYYALAFDQPVGVLEFSSFARWANQAVRITVRAGEATDVPLRVTQKGAF